MALIRRGLVQGLLFDQDERKRQAGLDVAADQIRERLVRRHCVGRRLSPNNVMAITISRVPKMIGEDDAHSVPPILR